ncbi:MAG: DUF4127 family protein [Candidatus Margulisiibacteriota bacterium]
MKKIILVPLDDRPCNLKFPVKIAASSGFQVVTPPRQYLGRFKEPGSPEKIISWLEQTSVDADSAIISADMLCFGGLIASRTPSVTFEEAEKRLLVVPRLKIKNPKLKIYLFSVLMRLSISADSEKNASVWRDVFEYSVVSDRSEKLGIPEDKKKLEELSAKIPEKVLSSYFSARKRNLSVNEACLALAGSADLVVIAKEDCAQFGPHKKEEARLKNLIKTMKIQGKTMILNGADEIGMCLLARHILSVSAQSPKIAVRYSFGKGRDISLYEDEPLDKVVSDHIDLVGAIRIEALKDVQKVFFVHSFEGQQSDLVFSGEVARSSDQEHHLKNFCSEIVMMGEIGREMYVADVFYANGSDRDFLEKLSELGDLKALLSYAGWNTSANSVGSALSAAFVPKNKGFVFERYVEDLGYQAVVRKHLEAFLAEKGISRFDLGDRAVEAENYAAAGLKKWAGSFFPKIGIKNDLEIKISFPWARTFEADCDIIFP